MKKISLFIVASVFAVAMNAQTGAKATSTSTTATATTTDGNTKPHVCTAACKDGKHVYAHGEKGHVCTDACKKTTAKKK